MKRQMTWLLAGTAAAFALATPLKAEVIEKSTTVAGMTVDYKVVLPDGYDPAKTYPAVLVFGGGPQNMTTVRSTARSTATSVPRRRSAATSSSPPRRRAAACSSWAASGLFRTS